MPSSEAQPPLLQLDGITKVFPGVVADDDVTLDLRAGEIHTILGENGAGKTTLMGVVYGLHRPDGGRLLIDDRPVDIRSPRDALARGIGYVQQHFSLIPTLTVAENLVLALHGEDVSPTVRGAATRVRELGERYGITVEPAARVEDLSIGQQQRAELLKALARDTRILILDEPGTVLTPQESEALGSVLRRLAAEGLGVFLISHKLEEVLRISDRISVLRRGRLVTTLRRDEADRGRLASAMVGEITRPAPVEVTTGKPVGPIRLEVRALSVDGDLGGRALEGASLQVRGGEIVGVAGIEGSGQVELTECIAGLRRPTEGEVWAGGRRLPAGDVRKARLAGVAHVPADRRRRGVVPTLTVAEDLLLPAVGRGPLSRFGLLDQRRIHAESRRLIDDYDIRTPGPDALVGSLSGGNQQKVVLARELREQPGIIVACYPTRGLDFAATEAVRRVLIDRAASGAAVLYVSTDLDELLTVSHRIIVLAHGRIAGHLDASEASAERLGLLMGGTAA